jgi:aspartyl-tRNA synthetase
LEKLENWRRSHYCGEITEEFMDGEVTIMGWVQRRRDHGGLIFVDLRDREGIVQLVFNPEDASGAHKKAHSLRSEFVLAVKGIVSRRPEGTENPQLKTGQVEVKVKEFKILRLFGPPFHDRGPDRCLGGAEAQIPLPRFEEVESPGKPYP